MKLIFFSFPKYNIYYYCQDKKGEFLLVGVPTIKIVLAFKNLKSTRDMVIQIDKKAAKRP